MNEFLYFIHFLLLSMGHKDSFKNLRNHTSDILGMHLSKLVDAVLKVLWALILRVPLIVLLGQTFHNFTDQECCILRNLVAQLLLLALTDTQNVQQSVTQDVVLTDIRIDLSLHNLGLLPIPKLHHLSDWRIRNGSFASHQVLSGDEWRVGDMLGEHHLIELLGKIHVFNLRNLVDVVEVKSSFG